MGKPKSAGSKPVRTEQAKPKLSALQPLVLTLSFLVLGLCLSGVFGLNWTSLSLHGTASRIPDVSSIVQKWTEILGGKTSLSFPPLIQATLDDVLGGLDAGAFTSVDLVHAYIKRILEVNSTLRCVAELNPDALAIAAELDAARSRGMSYGPLHGVPILLKDNIATGDKMENTAGSFALAGAKVREDSTVAVKLRDAGAILLGKTTMSEWANARSFHSSDGWSARAGQTVGAYFPGHSPSGSSSGSGVASSVGLALAALGTETCGSIVSPADMNNIVGIKPTVGLTSRYLVIPISEHQDTVGPMARTVKDAATILSVIAGRDPKDNYTSAIPFDEVPDYAAACDLSALSGTMIGVPRNLFENDTSRTVITAFDKALDVLRSAGATVIDNLTLLGYDVLVKHGDREWRHEMLADMVTDLNKTYFSQLSVNPFRLTSLADVRRYIHSDPREAWPVRDTGIFEEALDLGFTNESPKFWEIYMRNVHLAGEFGITGALRDFALDALVLPTDSAAPVLPALLGSPIVTVPLGRYPDDTPVEKNEFGNLNDTAPNRPFGISFMAERFSEEKLIGFAYAFEQRTLIRDTITPYLRPATELRDIVAQRQWGSWRLWK